MINIKNTQRKIKINKNKTKKIIQSILDYLDYINFDIGIWFTTNQTIKKYNKIYRNKNKATDILSFPFHTNIKAGKYIRAKSEDEKNLGDIIISLEYAQKAAKKIGVSLDTHIKTLLAHGICHLIGYEHKTDADYAKMQAKELEILEQI